MSKISYTDKLNQLIEDGDLQLAIRELSDKLKLVKDLILESEIDRYIEQTTTISYQYKRLNDNKIEGILSFSEMQNGENRILRSFLSLVKNIPLRYFYFLDLYLFDSIKQEAVEAEMEELIKSSKPSIFRIREITKKIRRISIQEFDQVTRSIGERLLEQDPFSIHAEYYKSLEALFIVALKRNESDSWLSNAFESVFDLLCLDSFVIRQAELEIHRKLFVQAVKKMGFIMYNLNIKVP